MNSLVSVMTRALADWRLTAASSLTGAAPGAAACGAPDGAVGAPAVAASGACDGVAAGCALEGWVGGADFGEKYRAANAAISSTTPMVKFFLSMNESDVHSPP